MTARDRAVGDVMPRQVTPRLKGEPKAKKRKAVAKVRKTPTATLKRKAVRLHSEYVRARDGRCMRCGKRDGLQCAHMVRRTYAATVTDELNARALCGSCHLFIDSHHFESVVFWSEQFGVEHYERTRAKAYAGKGQTMKSAFWLGEIERLERLIAAVR